MDFFEELGKQASKLIKNFSSTMDELSTMATSSVDSVANIILYRGKLENLRMLLEQDYKEIGKAYVDNPDQDHSQLIQKALATKAEMEAVEMAIRSLKSNIKEVSKETQKVTKENVEDVVMITKDSFEEQAQKVKALLTNKAGSSEMKYDVSIEEFDNENNDKVDSE